MEQQELKISFEIKAVFVTSFNIELKEEFVQKEEEFKAPFTNFIYEITCKNNAFVPQNIINLQTFVKIFLDPEKKIELGYIQLENVFEIKDLKLFFNDKENKLNLPKQFQGILIGISLSHTRAMLISKCAGTFLQNAILPIMNPSDFLPKEPKSEEQTKENKEEAKVELSEKVESN